MIFHDPDATLELLYRGCLAVAGSGSLSVRLSAAYMAGLDKFFGAETPWPDITGRLADLMTTFAFDPEEGCYGFGKLTEDERESIARSIIDLTFLAASRLPRS